LALERAAKYELDVAIGSDLSKILASVRPDVVFDCTVPQAHHKVTLTALEAGCHVLGEKPMADNPERAREMIAAAERSSCTYAVMQNRRYDPNLSRVKEVLKSGVLGELTTVTADFFIGAHFGGFRDTMPHILLKDMAIHTFDTARALCQRDATAVYCHEWNPAGSWYARDANAFAIFEMEGELVFDYRGSWCAEGLRTTWESEWRLVGANGSLRWDGADRIRAEIVAQSGEFFSEVRALDIPDADESEAAGHKGAILAFLDALEHSQIPETVCSDNFKSLAMVFAAVESSRTRNRVDVTW
jgi:predicted dehydrogenase